MIMSLRGFAASNDGLGCCSLLVTMLGNAFSIQGASPNMVMCTFLTEKWK